MSDYLELHGDEEGGDGDVTRGLRALYAAPADDSYWRGLEARILSHLATGRGLGWWDELDRWMRPALLAAALVLIAVGVALFRARAADNDVVYEVMLTPTPLPVETAVRPVLQSEREATFRYLMTRY